MIHRLMHVDHSSSPIIAPNEILNAGVMKISGVAAMTDVAEAEVEVVVEVEVGVEVVAVAVAIVEVKAAAENESGMYK